MTGEKLYITISDNRGRNGPVQPGPGISPIRPSEKEKPDLLGEYAKHQMMHLVKNTANQMVSFGISQIGFLYGEYNVQRKIEIAKSMIDNVVSIGLSAKAGLAMSGGNPIGAAIGAGVAVVGQVFSGLQNMHYTQINNNRQNYEIDMLRQRAGLDNLTNDSRTGV